MPQDSRFIEKAVAAGVKRVFIGLENIDPDNLSAAKKKQNHISDYRELLLEWRKRRVITYCGYIIGFPNDTPKSLVKRIQIIQRELPLDILEFSILTPLPGSEDHAKAVAKGVDIDPDLNKFDLRHVTTDHPRMSRDEWQESYRLAWRTYYTKDHIKTVIRRAVAGGPRPDTVAYLLTWFWAASTSTISTRSKPAWSDDGTAATAGRGCRLRTRSSSTPATGAGRSSPTPKSWRCSPRSACGRAGSNAIRTPRTIPTRRSGSRTTTTIRRCTSSPRRRDKRVKRPNASSSTSTPAPLSPSRPWRR